MIKKNIIILAIILAVLTVAGLIAGIFIYISQKDNNPPLSEEVENYEEIKKQQLKEVKDSYNKRFPDVVRGIITIVSDQKTTVKTDSGTEYLIAPARPMLFYKDSGIENGKLVEIRGKIMENEISLGSVILAK